MTLQQAKYLMAIIQCGSITKASKELYVAQSSLSATIQNIEQEYNIKLFRRSSKGVELTLAGQEFAGDLQRLLDHYRFIDEKYSAPQEDEVRLCISTQHHICGETAFMSLSNTINAEGFRMGFLESRTEQLLNDVENGVSDLGLMFYYVAVKNIMISEIRNRKLLFNHIAYGKPHIYIHKGHPLSAKTSVTPGDLKGFAQISYDAIGANGSLFTTALRKTTWADRLYYVTDRAMAYTIMRGFSAYTIGSGFLSGDEVYNDIISIAIDCDETIEIGWLVKSGQRLSDIAKEFIGLIKKLYCKPFPGADIPAPGKR